MHQDIQKLIQDEMNEDGDRIQNRPVEKRKHYKDLKEYLCDLDTWARKVRRDILVIEHHLKLGVDPKQFYGDPGDPPPPPE